MALVHAIFSHCLLTLVDYQVGGQFYHLNTTLALEDLTWLVEVLRRTTHTHIDMQHHIQEQ